jgi:uncharacterized MAPEG superfamily protein
MEIAQIYESTIVGLGAMALLMVIQLVFADIVSIKARHTPGSPVLVGHESLLFRSARTVGNTNESVAIFLLSVLFCIYSNASPTLTAYVSWGFIITRLFYAGFYYFNLQLCRSVTFGISILCLLALVAIGFSSQVLNG